MIVHVYVRTIIFDLLLSLSVLSLSSSAPSGTEEWGELICHKPNSGLFEIKMDTCDITTVGVEGTCSYKFITKKLLKSVCSVLYDDYACLISPKFTGSACCYLDGVKMSCLPSESSLFVLIALVSWYIYNRDHTNTNFNSKQYQLIKYVHVSFV